MSNFASQLHVVRCIFIQQSVNDIFFQLNRTLAVVNKQTETLSRELSTAERQLVREHVIKRLEIL